jgi:hypothetical protein
MSNATLTAAVAGATDRHHLPGGEPRKSIDIGGIAESIPHTARRKTPKLGLLEINNMRTDQDRHPPTRSPDDPAVVAIAVAVRTATRMANGATETKIENGTATATATETDASLVIARTVTETTIDPSGTVTGRRTETVIETAIETETARTGKIVTTVIVTGTEIEIGSIDTAAPKTPMRLHRWRSSLTCRPGPRQAVAA